MHADTFNWYTTKLQGFVPRLNEVRAAEKEAARAAAEEANFANVVAVMRGIIESEDRLQNGNPNANTR